MNEEKLILLVQKYPELWDTSHAFYRDQERKDAIWEEIAKNNFVNKTGDECKKKWFILRDGFRRSLNKRKTVTGQARKKIKPYRYEQQMQFLRPCFEERSQLTNFDFESDNEDEGDSFSEDLATETRNTFSSSVTSPPLPSPSARSSKSTTPSLRRKIKPTPVRAAEVLQSYLDKKTQSTQEGHLSRFFRSMELNVRTFPHPLQITAKQNIFEIVTKLEQQAATSSQVQRPPHFQDTLPQNNNQTSASYTLPHTYHHQPQHNQFCRNDGTYFTSTMGDPEQHHSQQRNILPSPDPSSHLTSTMRYPEQQHNQKNTLCNTDPVSLTSLRYLYEESESE